MPLQRAYVWKHAYDSITFRFFLATLNFDFVKIWQPLPPLPLNFSSLLLTSGIYTNKSYLSPHCDLSIIAGDRLKITQWEQREQGECARAHMPMLLIVEEMNIPLQSDWEMEMERGLYRD